MTTVQQGHAVHPATVRSVKLTKLMRQVQEKFSRPIIPLLVEEINLYGLSATADRLGVSKATLGYWVLKLGIETRRVALMPGETLSVTRPQ